VVCYRVNSTFTLPLIYHKDLIFLALDHWITLRIKGIWSVIKFFEETRQIFYIIVFSCHRNGRKKTACGKDKCKTLRAKIKCEVLRLSGAVLRLNGKNQRNIIAEAEFEMNTSHEKASCKTWIIRTENNISWRYQKNL
jgi:hypothetical protein